MNNYVGFAKDIHNLKSSKKGNNILGGVNLDNTDFEIVAHSDGDLILHAIASSLLGAMGSHITIGELFPDDICETKNMDSKEIVKTVLDLLKKEGYSINNVDITIVCQQIMLKQYLKDIKESLKKLLKIDHVGIKCTRFEDEKNMQIECDVICLLNK